MKAFALLKKMFMCGSLSNPSREVSDPFIFKMVSLEFNSALYKLRRKDIVNAVRDGY